MTSLLARGESDKLGFLPYRTETTIIDHPPGMGNDIDQRERRISGWEILYCGVSHRINLEQFLGYKNTVILDG